MLKEADAPLSLKEIAAQSGKTEKAAFKALRRLFKKGKIDTVNRRYKLAES